MLQDTLQKKCIFLSTPSVRRATSGRVYTLARFSISIHALREEGDHATHSDYKAVLLISIHALREEGDCRRCTRGRPTGNFYPRPP